MSEEYIDVRNSYSWLPDLYSLPLQINFYAKIEDKSGMICGLFSESQAEYNGEDSPAALSWFLHGSRADFDFRTKIFCGFPQKERKADDILLVPDQEYLVTSRIWQNRAEYWVDGVLYCTCELNEGDVPSEGYVGLGCYSGEGCFFRGLEVIQIDEDGNVVGEEQPEEPEIKPQPGVPIPPMQPGQIKMVMPTPILVPVMIQQPMQLPPPPQVTININKGGTPGGNSCPQCKKGHLVEGHAFTCVSCIICLIFPCALCCCQDCSMAKQRKCEACGYSQNY